MNIGPFRGQALTCFFPNGKYLIKAPIGSGKSFLFFDGPMFGLYKLANRNMLNALSKEGYIKILFEVNGEHYLVIRNLKAGKTKDSCASNRYKIEGDIGNLRSFKDEKKLGIVAKDIDIEKVLKQLHLGFEEIQFKNETDLQQNLQGVLQPKEVFLNTVFLMQDSENIFQLAPADRLTVLKNVFNLLAIDEGKEVIADKKREVTYKLKATADTSKYDTKLKSLLHRYTETFTTLLTFADYADIKTVITKKMYQDFLDDLDLIKEKITISDFAFDNFPADLVGDLQGRIAGYKEQYTTLQQKKQLIEREAEKSKSTLGDSQKKISELEQAIALIDKKISGLDPEKIEILKKEKSTLQAEQDDLEAKMPKKQFLQFYGTHVAELDFHLPTKTEDVHVNDLAFFTHSLVTFGKNVHEKIQNSDLQIKNLELRASQEKTTLEQEIKNMQEKFKDIQAQKLSLEEKIKLFDSKTEQQATYDCSKIGTNCPFIKVINKQHFDTLDEQKKRFLEERGDLEKKIGDMETVLKQREDALKQLSTTKEIPIEIIGLQQQQEKLQSLISAIKDFLNEVDYTSLQKDFASYQETETRIKSLDKEIGALEEMLRQVESLRMEKEKSLMQITSIKESLESLIKNQEAQQKEIISITQKIDALQPERLQKIEGLTTTIKEVGRDLQVLISEFKDVQIEVKALQEEEKMLNELYNIFSRELLLLVLQDSLPVLNDIINNYLMQVVDYQIKFELEKTASDKLELAASIIDEKGEREIKSLSGGQMIILKLVWMLSISSYIHSPILFLDETINNLDSETVGKVADMLEDFVQSRDMKLYTVTHSQQIQDMDIWDEVIEIESG